MNGSVFGAYAQPQGQGGMFGQQQQSPIMQMLIGLLPPQPLRREDIPMPGLNYSQGDVVVPTNYPNPQLTVFGVPQIGNPVWRGAAPPIVTYPVSPYTDPTVYNYGNDEYASRYGYGVGQIGNADRSLIQEEGPNAPHRPPWWGSPPTNLGAERPHPQNRGPTYYEGAPLVDGMLRMLLASGGKI